MTCGALRSASPAVLAVGGQGFAKTVAVRLSAWAKTLTRGTLRSTGALGSTSTTVEVVGVPVDTNRVANDLPGGATENTLPTRTHLSCAALGSASATVFTVGREGFTETIAVRLTAWAKALSGSTLCTASTLDAALTAVEVIGAKYNAG